MAHAKPKAEERGEEEEREKRERRKTFSWSFPAQFSSLLSALAALPKPRRRRKRRRREDRSFAWKKSLTPTTLRKIKRNIKVRLQK